MTSSKVNPAKMGRSRRSFLQAIAALPMLAGPGAAADDAGPLTALIDGYAAQKAKVAELELRQQELSHTELQQMPEPPAALCRRKADDRLFRFMGQLRHAQVAIGEPYMREEVSLLVRKPMMRNRDIPIWPDGTDYALDEVPVGRILFDFNGRVVREPWPLAQARADSIVAAQREWDAACEELQERLGIPAVNDALDEAYDAKWAIEDEIQEFVPRSAEQFRLKARFALEHLYCDRTPAEHASDMFAWRVLRDLATV
ncbi:MAG: hypothetical protein WBA29_05430 [Xanthobacteraceae bacterium]